MVAPVLVGHYHCIFFPLYYNPACLHWTDRLLGWIATAEKNTHMLIDERFSGNIVELSEGCSKVELVTTTEMTVDETGLIHGGFIFSVADYAAMVAVNHPFVVLGSANVKFLKPVRAGEPIEAVAVVTSEEGKKREVTVDVTRDGDVVFHGDFTCIVPAKHVLGE